MTTISRGFVKYLCLWGEVVDGSSFLIVPSLYSLFFIFVFRAATARVKKTKNKSSVFKREKKKTPILSRRTNKKMVDGADVSPAPQPLLRSPIPYQDLNKFLA